MPLDLRLDVIGPSVLAWNQSEVIVPSALKASLGRLRVGAVVTARCAWVAGALTMLSAPTVAAQPESLGERLDVAFARNNWPAVLQLVEHEPSNATTEAWRALALIRLQREAEFGQAFARLVSFQRVDVSSAPIGLWSLRQEISPECWAGLDRGTRAKAWKLAWNGLLDAREFEAHPFSTTLWPDFARLLEAVEPADRPRRVMAGGPRLLGHPELNVLAWCGAHLRSLATAAEWKEVEAACNALAAFRPRAPEALRPFRRQQRPGADVPNVVARIISALTQARPRRAEERAIGTLAALLAQRPRKATAFLAALDASVLLAEARALLPRKASKARTRLKTVHYRGSFELLRDQLDTIVGETHDAWFALRRHKRGWLLVEGSRDDVLASVPDVLFQEAVVQVLGG